MKRKRKYFQLLMLILQTTVFLVVYTQSSFAQFAEHHEYSGFIGDTRGDDIISAGEEATNLANTSGKKVVDIVVSPDGFRAYSIDQDSGNKLRVYKLTQPATSGDPVGIVFDREVDLNITNPQHIAITPDAEFLYISGNSKIIKINLKPITLYDANGNPSKVINAFELDQSPGVLPPASPYGLEVEFAPGITSKPKLGPISITPDGEKLIYALEYHKGVLGGASSASGAFGAIGALELENTLNPSSAGLSQQKLTLKLPWEKEIQPDFFPKSTAIETGAWPLDPEGLIQETESILSAFYAPYEITISPDGNYALIAGQGREDRGEITPFGVIPDDDDDTGGILVLNLNSGNFIQHIPSAVRNEKAFIRSRLRKFARIEASLGYSK